MAVPPPTTVLASRRGGERGGGALLPPGQAERRREVTGQLLDSMHDACADGRVGRLRLLPKLAQAFVALRNDQRLDAGAATSRAEVGAAGAFDLELGTEELLALAKQTVEDAGLLLEAPRQRKTPSRRNGGQT